VTGYAFIQHGFPKMFANGELNAFHWMGPNAPVPGFLQALAALSEFGGGIALMVGLLTPAAALGIMATMFVAITTVFKGAPFVSGDPSQKTFELAGVYFAIVFTLLLTGPGAYSLDNLLSGRLLQRKRATNPAKTVTA
jgi:putative oxidoreductase